MKYKIKEVLPAQILVEFEDESIALVPISPEATSEEIDHAVAQYDPDFLPNPEDLLNQNISSGEERESKKIDTFSPSEEFSQVQTDNINYMLALINPINSILANYYAEKGDTRIKEALNLKVEEYLNKNNLTVESIIENINTNPSNITL